MLRPPCQIGEPGTEPRVAGNSDYSRIAPRVCRRWLVETKLALSGWQGRLVAAWSVRTQLPRTTQISAEHEAVCVFDPGRIPC